MHVTFLVDIIFQFLKILGGACLFFFASSSFSRARSIQTWHCNQEGVEDGWPFTDVDPPCQSICPAQFHSWVFLTVLYQPAVGSSPGMTPGFSGCRMRCSLPRHTWRPEHFLSSCCLQSFSGSSKCSRMPVHLGILLCCLLGIPSSECV